MLRIRQEQVALLVEGKERIPGDFPEMPVGIGEIARIAAPENILQRLHGDARPPSTRKRIDLVGLLFRARIVGERDGGKARGLVLDAGILGEIGAAEETEREAVRLEERDPGWLAVEAFQPQAS